MQEEGCHTARWGAGEKQGPSFIVGGNANGYLVLLRTDPKELEISVYTKSCPRVFIAALVIITETWKPPRCPSAGEPVSALHRTQSAEHHSALKRNA